MDYLVHHMLRSSSKNFPEKEALVHGKERLSYAKVGEMVMGLAEGLRRAGLTRGDRVGIYLEPSVAQVVSIFAISQAGGVFVPINHVLFPDQVEHIANDCNMAVLITTQSKLAQLGNLVKNVPTVKFVVAKADTSGPESEPVTFYDFDEWCGHVPEGNWRDVNIGKDLAALLYTSGSTGKPKGVMLSHAQIMAGSSIVSSYLGITEKERILAVLPFSFDAGLNQLMTAFQQGGTLIVTTFTFAKEIVQVLLDERVSGLAGVPTLWSLLAQRNSTLGKTTLPYLRYITNTGGAMPQTVLATLRQWLPGVNIVLMYGLTEAFRSTYLPPDELDRRPTSMGKAIPNTEILVVNEEGKSCKPGEIGELVHRGPTVSMGYWGQPELTAKVLRPHPFLPPQLADAEQVCYSGDLVKMDEEGYLYFVGRRDMMIKSSGYRISPTEVEEVLFKNGMVQVAAVIGLPDPVLGQVIKAFVVPKAGQDPNCEMLSSFCAERLPRHMVPKVFEILECLPKTSSGKVDYAALRRREGV